MNLFGHLFFIIHLFIYYWLVGYFIFLFLRIYFIYLLIFLFPLPPVFLQIYGHHPGWLSAKEVRVRQTYINLDSPCTHPGRFQEEKKVRHTLLGLRIILQGFLIH